MERKEIRVHSGSISYLHRSGRIPVIFLHGLGGTGNSWIRLARHLDPSMDLYFPDLPGHGRSSKNYPEYTILSQARIMKQFTDALSLNGIILAGNSYGGWISLKFAISLKQPDGLILVDSAGTNPTVGEMSGRFHEEFVDRVMSMSSYNDRGVIEKIVANNARQEEKITEEELRSIGCRTAVIWGSEDRMIPLEYGVMLHQNIHGSRMSVMENTGHLPQIENPEKLAEIINTFIRDNFL